MLNSQHAKTLALLDTFDTKPAITAYRTLANTAGMRAMAAILGHFYFDPARAAKEAANAQSEVPPSDEEHVPTAEERNILDEARRTESDGTSMPDLQRRAQGFTPGKSRLETAEDWIKIHVAAIEELVGMGAVGEYDQAMNPSMLFDYNVRSSAGRALDKSQAAADSLGLGMNVRAAESQVVETERSKFEDVRAECINMFIDIRDHVDPDFQVFDELDVANTISVTTKIAGKLVEDAVKLAHRTQGYMHLFAADIDLLMDAGSRLEAEADRLIKTNKQAVYEALSRNWTIPTIPASVSLPDPSDPQKKRQVTYNLPEKLASWRKKQLENQKVPVAA